MTDRRRIQAGAPHGAPHPAYYRREAHREGWTVERTRHADGSETVEIRHLGRGSRFADDEEARRYVVTQARAGSPLHRAALDVCDPTERKLLRLFYGEWRAEGEEAG